jgi:hypothetical protein
MSSLVVLSMDRIDGVEWHVVRIDRIGSPRSVEQSDLALWGIN